MGIVDIANKFFYVMLHLEEYLGVAVANYGPITYLFLFIIIFLETGLVLTPLLPGDSLLFAVGTMASANIFNIWLLWVILASASILGDTCNYFIGEIIGLKLINGKRKLINKKHIIETKAFFKKHGSKTIILARFIPIVRTFAPFMAGVGKMEYGKFLIYNIIGGIAWVGTFLFMGYFFGKLPFVQEHFSLVVIGIVLTSFIPLIWMILKDNYPKIRVKLNHMFKKTKNKQRK